MRSKSELRVNSVPRLNVIHNSVSGISLQTPGRCFFLRLGFIRLSEGAFHHAVRSEARDSKHMPTTRR